MTKKSGYFFTDEDINFIKLRNKSNRIVTALYLKHYKTYGMFPNYDLRLNRNNKKEALILTDQLNVEDASFKISQKTKERILRDIRDYCKIAYVNKYQYNQLLQYLYNKILPQQFCTIKELKEISKQYLRDKKLTMLSDKRLNTLVSKALLTYEENLCDYFDQQLSFEQKAYLDGLIICKSDNLSY